MPARDGTGNGSGRDAGLVPGPAMPDPGVAVTALYREHALGLTRLASRALAYVRSAVLNGCRSEFRRRKASRRQLPEDTPGWSAESAALASEERREVLRALARLPARQREALVLRYYLGLSEAETADAMRVTRGTVKSTAARGIASLRQMLGEES